MAASKPEADTVVAINRVLDAEREMTDAVAAAQREAETILETARTRRRRILERARARASRLNARAGLQLERALAELEANAPAEDDEGGEADAALAQAVQTLVARLTSADDDRR